MSRSVVLGTTAIVLALASGTVRAEKTVPIWEQEDQYEAVYRAEIGVGATIMDQYAEKLSADGRWGFVDKCFNRYSYGDTDHMEKILVWALCSDDLKTFDPAKFKNAENKTNAEKWLKVGAEIEAEAKEDPGVAAILKQVEAAKADWKDFEAKNHDAVVLFHKLKAGVRTGKSNASQFDGCWEATQPAFAKAVKATKFSWDNDDRVAEIVTSPANYYAVANFGMCAYAVHPTGAVLAGAALRANGGVFGWRTMLISKLLAPTFKPKFADRSLACCAGEHGAARHIMTTSADDVTFPWPGGSMKDYYGVVKKMTKDGDDTLVQFKGIVLEECVDWKETGKIRTWDTAGDPVYERKCLKRGKVEQDAPDDTTMATKFLDGVAAGLGLVMYGGFPEEVYDVKKKKFISILGVSVKGSPAETPLKE